MAAASSATGPRDQLPRHLAPRFPARSSAASTVAGSSARVDDRRQPMSGIAPRHSAALRPARCAARLSGRLLAERSAISKLAPAARRNISGASSASHAAIEEIFFGFAGLRVHDHVSLHLARREPDMRGRLVLQRAAPGSRVSCASSMTRAPGRRHPGKGPAFRGRRRVVLRSLRPRKPPAHRMAPASLRRWIAVQHRRLEPQGDIRMTTRCSLRPGGRQ